jgi:hypothetical protein
MSVRRFRLTRLDPRAQLIHVSFQARADHQCPCARSSMPHAIARATHLQRGANHAFRSARPRRCRTGNHTEHTYAQEDQVST